MKTSLYSTIVFILALIIVLSGCSIQKRNYRKGYYIDWNKDHVTQSVSLKRNASVPDKNASKAEHVSTTCASEILKTKNPQLPERSSQGSAFSDVVKNKRIVAAEPCLDTIELTSGAKMVVSIIEISPTAVKYKKCDNIDGPTYQMEKSVISRITYANGLSADFDQFKPNPRQPIKPVKVEKKMHWAAIASLVFAFISLFLVVTQAFALIVLTTLLGFIFGLVAIIAIAVNPEKYKGIGLAITGLFISLIFLLIIAAIIILWV